MPGDLAAAVVRCAEKGPIANTITIVAIGRIPPSPAFSARSASWRQSSSGSLIVSSGRSRSPSRCEAAASRTRGGQSRLARCTFATNWLRNSLSFIGISAEDETWRLSAARPNGYRLRARITSHNRSALGAAPNKRRDQLDKARPDFACGANGLVNERFGRASRLMERPAWKCCRPRKHRRSGLLTRGWRRCSIGGRRHAYEEFLHRGFGFGLGAVEFTIAHQDHALCAWSQGRLDSNWGPCTIGPRPDSAAALALANDHTPSARECLGTRRLLRWREGRSACAAARLRPAHFGANGLCQPPARAGARGG